MGRRIANVLNKSQTEGTHTAIWSVMGIGSQKVEKGIYFIEIKIDAERIVNKLIVN